MEEANCCHEVFFASLKVFLHMALVWLNAILLASSVAFRFNALSHLRRFAFASLQFCFQLGTDSFFDMLELTGMLLFAAFLKWFVILSVFFY